MVVVLAAPNQPKNAQNEGGENEGQTEAYEVDNCHNDVCLCCFAELSGKRLPVM